MLHRINGGNWRLVGVFAQAFEAFVSAMSSLGVSGPESSRFQTGEKGTKDAKEGIPAPFPPPRRLGPEPESVY